MSAPKLTRASTSTLKSHPRLRSTTIRFRSQWFGGFGSSLVDRSTRTNSSDDLTFCTRSRRRERGQNCQISQMGIFSGVIHILIGRFMGSRLLFAFRLLRATQWERSRSVVSFGDSIDQANTKCHFACRYFRPSVRRMSFWLASLSTRRLRRTSGFAIY